jgi:glycosyltransferase involved in cell wall biosynthesis
VRVAFTLIGGREWTGGYNYLVNLLRVLHANPDCGVEPVLFVGPGFAEESLAPLRPLLRSPPVRDDAFERRLSTLPLARAALVGDAPAVANAFIGERIDVAFEAAQFYGWRFPVAALAWTPDFQHRHLPHMFSRRAWWRRELGTRAQVGAGRTLMLSSEDARQDAERFYPGSLGRTVVVRFAVLPPPLPHTPGAELLARHGLPERFLYLPNQFWKHKNHEVVIDALARLKARGERLVVAASGNPEDVRHADHYRRLTERVRDRAVGAEFRFLGMVPYEDVIGLTALCQALINPSFFEGWSTTVEEAKALGAPLVLSDLAVHREQAGNTARYFDPQSPDEAAGAILEAWRRHDLPAAPERWRIAARESHTRVTEFAFAFAGAAAIAREQHGVPRHPLLAPSAATIARRRGPPRRRVVRAHAKVLLVHNYYRSITPGGEDNVFRQEQELLRAGGLEVVTYTKHNDDVDEDDPRQVLRTAAGMPWAWPVYHELRELIQRERPDLAHFHNTFPLISPSAYAACKELNLPIVQTLHNYRLVCCAGTFFRDGAPCQKCTSASPWAGVRHRCYRGSLAGSAAVAWMLRSNWRRGIYTELIDVYVALTQFAADRFAAEGLPRERIVINPNFVDSTGPPSAGGGGYAVFAARLSEEKGIPTVLKAWRELRDVPLKVVGDGPLLAEFVSSARAEGLPIEFLGMQPRADVLELIGRADLQVVASECYEGFPLVVAESYARGTPVVASHIGGLIEIIRPEETGLHFEVGNAGSLVAQVRRLWGDPALRARLRIGARRRYEAEYTPERSLERLLAIYERARAVAAARAAALAPADNAA